MVDLAHRYKDREIEGNPASTWACDAVEIKRQCQALISPDYKAGMAMGIERMADGSEPRNVYPNSSWLNSTLLFLEEDVLVVVQKRHDSFALHVHIGKFALWFDGAHDGWPKHDGKVDRCHLDDV
jgi:hypothetical protein